MALGRKNIEFQDNTDEVLRGLDAAIIRGLTAIGIEAEANAKREITRLVYSRGDTEKKYRLTGRLRNSITFALAGEEARAKAYNDDDGKAYKYDGVAPGEKGSGVYIGSNVEYAPYVEMGTSRTRARPFLRPAAADHGQRYKQLMAAAIRGNESEK